MNIQRFFNKKPRNPGSPYRPGRTLISTKDYSSRIGRRIKETPTIKKLLSIHKKVKTIENLLGGIGNLDKKIVGVQTKAETDKKKEEKNKKKKGNKTNNLFGGLQKTLSTDFLDVVRNFVTFTFLGWLFTFLQPHLDKMQFILPVIQTAFDVMIFILKNILGGIGNTLKAFYFAKDTITGATDKIKQAASGIQKTFDDTLIAIKDVVNGTIEVANSFIEATGEKFNKVETVDTTNIPQLPQVPKFDENTPTPQTSFAVPTQTNNTLPPGIPMIGAATGGRIDPSTPVTRGIQPEERQDRRISFKPTIQEQKTTPGKDVGGIDKVKELYSSSSTSSGFSLGFFTISPTNQKDGFLALNKISQELKVNKSEDFLGLGNFMGAAVDVSLGQKPDKRTYQQFASGIKYLVDYGISNPDAFQKMNLERLIENMVNTKVDVAINRIREEINKRSSTETPDGEGGGATPGGGTAGGEYGGYAPSGIQKEIYEYLTNVKKLNDIQALGIMANIFRESGFRVDAKQPDGPGIGLFQYSSAGRKSAFIQAVPDWEKNWKAQIDYALREPGEPGPEYMRTNFKTPQEAADWWMRRWERPSEYIQTTKGPKKHEEYLATIPKAPDGSVKFREAETQFSTDYLQNLQSVLPGLTLPGQRYRAERDGGSREHAGRDYDLPTNGVFYSRIGGVVIFAGNVGGGYGNVVDIYNKDLNRTERIAEGTTILQGIRVGASVSPGQPVVSGTHQTGVIHYEIRRGRAGSSGSVKGTEDPDQFLTSNEYKSYIEKIKTETIANKERAPQQLSTQQKQDIHNKLISKGQIPFNVGNESYYFVALADGTYRAYRNRNILGANVPEAIDITGNTNKPIQTAIRQTINKMYPLPSLSTKEKDKKKKGGLVYEQNSSALMPPQKYASYNEPQMVAKIFIQPVIVPTPSASASKSPIAFPTINLSSTKNPKLIKQ